jgi:hypothetical protein
LVGSHREAGLTGHDGALLVSFLAWADMAPPRTNAAADAKRNQSVGKRISIPPISFFNAANDFV